MFQVMTRRLEVLLFNAAPPPAQEHGLRAELDEVEPGRVNVLVHGGRGGCTVMLLGHLDTVGGAAMVEPGPHTSLRLSFGLLDPEELDEGVRRLAAALRAVRRYDRLSATAPLS